MKIPARIQFCVFIAALSTSLVAHSSPGQEPSGPTKTDFAPPAKLAVTLQSQFHSDKEGKITYRYTIINHPQNKQTLGLIIFDHVAPIIGARDDRKMGGKSDIESATAMAALKTNAAALSTPTGWDGSITFGLHHEDSRRVGWNPHDTNNGIKPGTTLPDFGFSSEALPGIGTAQMEGDSSMQGLLGKNPPSDGELLRQLRLLEESDHAVRNAAVPTIIVPSPFDPVVTLERIQAHMRTWVDMRLLDRTFHSQLRSSSLDAIKAYRLNQPKVARNHLETMRALIKKEQPGADKPEGDIEDGRNSRDEVRIDKLAARILDFDVHYVMKRTNGKSF